VQTTHTIKGRKQLMLFISQKIQAGMVGIGESKFMTSLEV